MATQTGWPSEGINRRHAPAAVIACLLSLGMHFGGLVLLSKLGFEISVAHSSERNTQRKRSMRVNAVEREPLPQPVPEPEHGEGSLSIRDDDPLLALQLLAGAGVVITPHIKSIYQILFL